MVYILLMVVGKVPFALQQVHMQLLLLYLDMTNCQNQKNFLKYLNNADNFFCSTFTNVTLIIEDFNIKPENKKLNDFWEMNKLENSMF